MYRRTLLTGLALTAATVALTAAPAQARTSAQHHQHPRPQHCPQLSTKLPWFGDNRAKLQRTIDERGVCSPGYDRRHRPVAAFDWDNTLVKNDSTDATIVWALKNDKILRPRSWAATSQWLTPAADRALTEACGTDVPVGRPLPTSTNTACADEILEVRGEARTMSGQQAFAGDWNHRRTVPQYAWVPQLFAGHTVAELRSYARHARDEFLAAPIGATERIGSHTVPGYSRYYAQQKDLIRTLKKAGFNVNVVSAGSEPVAEEWAKGIGVNRAHTYAIRSVVRHGRITTYTKGCGDVPDSQGGVIPYIEGKRCVINQEIFGIKGADAWKKQNARHRIAIGGGDADTDVTFVGDATGTHLVLNRNKPEIMCRGYDDADGRWAVNPMFIEPLPAKRTPYPCSTTAFTRPDGSQGPVRRDDGSVIPDQHDTAHGPGVAATA
ncbi:haloacid dehalogenase-like hydrolase [Streptomyces boncukensis]|uniref:phosphoserine phosphatase n=1 Tax=Streptomyces boncukensis TaxID=2711219 RepID=A0A6G4WR51_9ACTN|nr:haloacid dehalogenase-like hydrolase [Streptomyces boncukensis]NGO67312.1 haloacid dehalogenase-like hydrolase [Streptomyces boncukensis]